MQTKVQEVNVFIASSGLVAITCAFGQPTSPQLDCGVALAEVSVTTEALVACGLEVSVIRGVSVAIARATEERVLLQGAIDQLVAIDSQLSSVRLELEAKPGDLELIAQRDGLLAQRVAQLATVAGRREDLLQVGLALCGQGVGENLARFRATAGVDIPAAYRVVGWSQAEVRKLARAIKSESRASRSEAALSEQDSTLLSQARQETRVQIALQSLSANLAAAKLALEQPIPVE